MYHLTRPCERGLLTKLQQAQFGSLETALETEAFSTKATLKTVGKIVRMIEQQCTVQCIYRMCINMGSNSRIM